MAGSTADAGAAATHDVHPEPIPRMPRKPRKPHTPARPTATCSMVGAVTPALAQPVDSAALARMLSSDREQRRLGVAITSPREHGLLAPSSTTLRASPPGAAELGQGAQARVRSRPGHCPKCGGKPKIIAAILEQPVIEKIVTHLGLQAREPPRAPASSPASESLSPSQTNPGGGDEGRTWLDTDRHSRTRRWRGCCRRRAQRGRWWRARWVLGRGLWSGGARMRSPGPPEGGPGLRAPGLRL